MLKDKVIATLGATGGIGSAIQKHLHRQGAKAIAIGRSAQKLEALKAHSSGQCIVDLLKPADWEVNLKDLPPLDGLVLCSGVLDVLPFRAAPVGTLAQSLEVNVNAPAMLLRHLLRAGKIKPGASIVFIGSIAGIRGAIGHSAYTTSKAALLGLMHTLALELAGEKIRVNVVSPGLVEAGMFTAVRATMTETEYASYIKSYPLGLGQGEDIAGPVAFLLSSDARWITGHNLVVDGGVTVT